MLYSTDHRPFATSAVIGTANGFRFDRYDAQELYHQLIRAVEAYGDREIWAQLVQNGMQPDWSWRRSAGRYVDVYNRARAQRTVAATS